MAEPIGAEAIEASTVFREHFPASHPLGTVHPAAVEFARLALASVRDLHRPRWYDPYERSGQVWLTCAGCDAGAHSESPPGWPCSTAELVYSAQEIADRQPPQLPECPKHPRAQVVFVRPRRLTEDDHLAFDPLQARRWACDHVAAVPVDPADPWDF